MIHSVWSKETTIIRVLNKKAGALFQSFIMWQLYFFVSFSSAADAINLIHYFSKEKLILVFATDEEK